MSADDPFFAQLWMLRATLEKHGGDPSALADVERYLRDPDIRREFFRVLKRADWIAPLRDAGYFERPPMPIITSTGGLQHPLWPESTYLSRMAELAPDDVATIFSSIALDNVSVVGNLLEAALAMPTDIASRLVPAVIRAANQRSLWLHFKHATDLCVKLVNSEELAAAMALAGALFAPKLEDGRPEPSGRDTFWYRDGLKKVVPAFVTRTPKIFLVMFANWLKEYVGAQKNVDLETGADYSYMWRPAIEEHEQNSDYDLVGAMVGFFRQGLEQAIRGGTLSFQEALEIVDHHFYLVFRRIRIHLINEFAECNPALARQTIMDRKLFDDHEYKHEYARLVGRRLNLLTTEERNAWFGWIDAGPDLGVFDKSVSEHLGREATDEELTNRKAYWQFEKLHWVREHLEGQQQETYNAMIATHGEPKLADLNVHVGTRWGHDSPMKVEDLAKLTFERAVEEVSLWTPRERRFAEPGIEGLASTFENYVETKPEAFSEMAGVLIGRPAIYVRAFVQQMAKAVKKKLKIDIASVVDLCNWVLEQPLDAAQIPKAESEGLVDRDWQWTRNEISQFVKNVCEADSGDGPIYTMEGVRERLWQIVATLSRAPVKSSIAYDTPEDDPRVNDYLTLGINSSRGRAVEAALEYARWVAKHIKKPGGNRDVIPGGFMAMPEFQTMLEWQLSPDNRSFEAFAVIGSHIGLIYWIDKRWLSTNGKDLFCLAKIEDQPPLVYGWAAWNAFLVWVAPHIEYYGLFKEQFSYAVDQSARVQLIRSSHEQPMYRLGEHLMILYGRGDLDLDDDEGLLRRFLAHSRPDIRRHAIEFIGQSVGGGEAVPQGVVSRFRSLWDIYWQEVGKQDAKEKPGCWLFGAWFSSRQFPKDWALEQLEEYINVTGARDPDDSIVEEIARVAETNPHRAVGILDQVVRGSREGWRVAGWLEPTRTTLQIAMKKGSEARARASRLIDHLGRCGYTDIGDLLRSGENRH